MNLVSVILFLFSLTKICESAKILYVMPFAGRSHYHGMRNLALELANRGHDVYCITAFKEDSYPKTFHPLMVSSKSIWVALFGTPPNVFTITDYFFPSYMNLLFSSGLMSNEQVFNSTDVQNFLKEDHKIDLVVCELFYNENLYMFAHKYQAPLILVSTFGNSMKTSFHMRNPLQLSTLYHEYGTSSDPLSFIGRLRNLYFTTVDFLMLKLWYYPRQQEYVEHYFKDAPQPLPSIEEMTSRTSLVLMNSHFSVSTPGAYLPNFVEVGGFHIRHKNSSLPQDLQKILDDAKDGVVLLSLGSNVQSTDLGDERLQAFLTVFGELKQTVLMKWEDETLPNVPKNVILRSWFPQREILAHPNIKLFICHGGLLGLQETTLAGVPILGIPVFGDQYNNVNDVKNNGHGELLEHADITEEKLRELVNKLLSEKNYMKIAKEVSKKFQDRPMSPLDTAVWWTEYVIRHKGANFMKSPGLKMNYFAFMNFDLFLFVYVIILMFSFVTYKIVRATFRLITGFVPKPKLKKSYKKVKSN